MATSATLSPSAAIFSSTSTAKSPPRPTVKAQQVTLPSPSKQSLLKVAATGVACATLSTTLAALLTATPPALAAADSSTYHIYYGTAASAANYGGYGGNSNKEDSAEYVYDVPDGWKERLVSKVEKGTNGTDSEFYNPKKRTEKEYLTYLSGFRQLAPKDVILNNLALSDVDLQDLIASDEDGVKSEETRDDKGQLYYVYEINGAGAHSLISVTCAKNKLYAHFVNAPNAEWNRDQETLRHLHQSFRTVGSF